VFCRSGLATGQLLAFLELFLDVSVKLIEQTLQLGHLRPNLRQRGLWGVADPHFLCNQALQLILLAAKGIDYADCCFRHCDKLLLGGKHRAIHVLRD
jgi:hypothetical protein